ncbi:MULTISPECIES: hypothetical protein [Kingella]|nr:hypothetical protein [Kingella bonacorsii]
MQPIGQPENTVGRFQAAFVQRQRHARNSLNASQPLSARKAA